MNVLPTQKTILAGLTGVGSFVFAYNMSKTWNVQTFAGRKSTASEGKTNTYDPPSPRS